MANIGEDYAGYHYLGTKDGTAIYKGPDGLFYWGGKGDGNTLSGFTKYNYTGSDPGALDPTPTTTPTTTTTNTPPPSTGGSENLTAPFTTPWNAPAPVDLGGPKGIEYIPPVPELNLPSYQKPPAFSYGDFKAPTLEEAQNSPGYQFRVGQGVKQLDASAAARGIINSLGYGRDVLDYGQNAASQEYQNVFGRDLATYQTNRAGAVDAYNINYGTQYKDPYTFDTSAALAQFAPKLSQWQTQAAAGQHQNDLNYLNDWNKWLQDWNIFRDQRDSTFDKKYKVATL